MRLSYCGTAMLSTGEGAAASSAAISMTANATPTMHKNPMKNLVKVLVKYFGFIPVFYHNA